MKYVNPWALFSIGLVLILAGNSFTYTELKIDFDALLVNLGALLSVIGVLQVFIDHQVHRKLIDDSVRTAVGVSGAVDLGVESAMLSSKEIASDERWITSKRFFIGTHYSKRLLSDFSEVHTERRRAGRTATILHVEGNGIAAKYLTQSLSGKNIPAKLGELQEFVSRMEEKPGRGAIRLKRVDRVLRYSFILLDDIVYVIFFTNSTLYSKVPAFVFRKPSKMFAFFEADILDLEAKAGE
jgi:hypothetical protein